MAPSSDGSAPMIICVDWPAGAKRGGFALPGRDRLALGLGILDAQAHAAHRLANSPGVLLRREALQTRLRRQLHVDRKPVRPPAGFGKQVGIGIRNRFEVDVAAENFCSVRSLRATATTCSIV